MINEKIIAAVISVFQHCEVISFPINCENLLMQYGYEVKKYSELSGRKRKACMDLSEDATTLDGTVFYNDSKPNGRIRFSLMHELGHIVLNTDSEKDADTFSSNLLAPRMAIHYSKCKRSEDVAKTFVLSKQAAQVAFDDYIRWFYSVSTYGMTRNDKKLYTHFYNEKANKFVWKSDRCKFCYNEVAYNEASLCTQCKIFEIKKLYTPRIIDDFEHNLSIARSNWLYGNL